MNGNPSVFAPSVFVPAVRAANTTTQLPGVPTPAAVDDVESTTIVAGETPPRRQQRQLRVNFLAEQQQQLRQDQRHPKAAQQMPQFNHWLEPEQRPQLVGGILRGSVLGTGFMSQWTVTPVEQTSLTGSVSSITKLFPQSASSKKGSKKSRDRVLSLLAAATLFEGALLIGFIVFTYFYMKSTEREGAICQSPACVRTAASLLRSMDTRVSPCEDFYQYTCGRWSEDHPSPAAAFSHDWFYDRREHVLLGVREFLKRNSTDGDPWAVQQARVLFQACLNREAWEALGLEPMLSTLESTGLPRKPPLTVDSAWSWEQTAVFARKLINKDLLVNLDVVPDIKNRSVNRILLRKYRSGSPLLGYQGRRLEDRRQRILARSWWRLSLTSRTNQDQSLEGSGEDAAGEVPSAASRDAEDDERHIAAYLAYMTTTMNILMNVNKTKNATSNATSSPSSPTSSYSSSSTLAPLAPAVGFCPPRASVVSANVTKAARLVLDFNEALYKIAFPENKTSVRDKDPEEMWVWELQNFTDVAATNGSAPQINWTEYLTLMFQNVPNVTLDLTKDKIMVEDDDFLRSLSELLSNTSLETLQLSLWWELVDLLAPYTTSEMRQLRRRYQEIASGTSAARTRESVCTEAVNSLMGMAVSYDLADSTYLRTTGEEVQEMLADVKSVFEDLVAELDWMDPPTKAATLEKVRAMKSFVGFPEWLVRPKDLNEYYEGLNMTRDAFLEDMLSFQQLVTTSTLTTLRRLNDEDGWATDPTDVNAFHTFQANSVTIPAGILQFPFYDLGLEALNYGAIGSILGHELTHGFDSYGRLFDKNGNMRPWWSNATVAEYENRTACFVKQYGDYFLPEVDMNVDGELTLGENIADNGGLHESVRAYRRYIARHRVTEPLLPGMANYTHEQLLFLSYVHLWCESWTEESLRWSLEDEHAPNRIRTWGVLSNSKDFAQAWGCDKGAAMNPDRPRCRLW